MIWKIEYTRTIENKAYAKTATFITKKTESLDVYRAWLKQHSKEFQSNVVLKRIGLKYLGD